MMWYQMENFPAKKTANECQQWMKKMMYFMTQVPESEGQSCKFHKKNIYFFFFLIQRSFSIL